MGVCAQCIHFRPVRPLSQLLAKAIVTQDGPVAEALAKVVEDEAKVRDAEAQFKSAETLADRDVWASRPLMADYCGFREPEGIYLIAAVKNRGGQCQDFAAGKPERRACDSCVHRAEPAGAAKDLAHEKAYAKMARGSISVGHSSSVPDSLLNEYREGVTKRKAFEVSGAYHAQGVVAMEPHYLAWCRHFSGEELFMICAMKNTHNTCSAWQGASATEAKPAASTGMIAAAGVVPPAIPALPQSPVVAGTSRGEVLDPGPPPLTESMIADLVGFFGWMLDVRVPDDTRALLRATVIDQWRKRQSEEMQVAQQCLAIVTEVDEQTEEVRVYWRESSQQAFVARLRDGGDQLSRALVALYDSANAPIAPGDPPLTREVVEAALDVIMFMIAAVRQRQPAPVPPQWRESWRQQLTAVYASLSPMERGWLFNAPLLFATLRVQWPPMPEPARAALRAQFEADLDALGFTSSWWRSPAGYRAPSEDTVSRIVHTVSGIVQGLGELYGRARPATGGNRGGGRSPETARQSPRTTVEQDLAELRKFDRQEEEELEKLDPKLAHQQKMQNEQARLTMISNMSKMMHETSMSIINNMRV